LLDIRSESKKTLPADNPQNFVAHSFHELRGLCLHIQPQKWFRVGGSDVEPPELTLCGSPNSQAIKSINLTPAPKSLKNGILCSCLLCDYRIDFPGLCISGAI